MTLEESIGLIQGVWSAYKAASKSPRVVALLDSYLFTMRRAAITVLVHLESLKVPAEVKDAAQAVFIAVHDHEFEQMMRQDSAATELETSIVRLGEATQKMKSDWSWRID